MQVWVVEYREQVPPYQSMVEAVLSSREKALGWIVKYGKTNIQHDSDYFSVECFSLDPTNDKEQLPPEYFHPDGSPIHNA